MRTWVLAAATAAALAAPSAALAHNGDAHDGRVSHAFGGAAAADAVAVDVEGKLVIAHEDPRRGVSGHDGYVYLLKSHGRYFDLALAGKPAAEPGERVEVTGLRDGRRIVVRKLTEADATVAGGAPEGGPAPIAGTDDVLIMPVSWAGVAPDGVTPAQAVAQVGSTDSAWYRETSYGAFALNAASTPWLTIANPGSGCPLSQLITNARNAAIANGFNPALYDREMVYIPGGAGLCPGAAGYGEVGGKVSWILGSMNTRVTVHELGHNVGLWHSHSLRCRSGASEVPFGGVCDPIDEYGDPFDAMGAAFSGSGHFNAFQKDLLGWMAGRKVTVAAPVGSAQTFTLGSMETNGGTKGLAVTTPTRTFWFEFRRPTGNDTFMGGFPGALDGVLVHVPEPAAGTNGSDLLDMKSNTAAAFGDAALPVAKTYTDPAGTFTLRVNSVSASGAVVTVGPALTRVWGYAWADKPTSASYTPALDYQRNSSGAVNTIQRTGVGAYTVTMPGIGQPGGTVNVTAYGTGTQYCKVASWFPSGGDQLVNVRCFNATGAPADTQFDVSFAQPVDGPGQPFAYVWAHDVASAASTPSIPYQFNSAGGINTMTRSGVGAYAVRLPGLGASAGTVKVTAYGSSSDHCKVASWGPSGADQVVNVRCFTAAGAAVDSRFALTYARNLTYLGANRRTAYVWADQPAAIDYAPSASYRFNSTGAVNRVQRGSLTGRYTVLIPNLGLPKGNVQVTAYGTDTSRCKVVSWGPSGTTQKVNVRCDRQGLAANTRFVLQYTE